MGNFWRFGGLAAVLGGLLVQSSPALAVVRLGEPLGVALPGGEMGLVAIAAGGVIGGILIARRKR